MIALFVVFCSYNVKALQEAGTELTVHMMNNGDETHVVSPCKLKTDKKYKEEKFKGVIAAICALLNSNGGKVRVYGLKSNSSVSRMLEQIMISIIGPYLAASKICIEENDDSLVILVENVDALTTTSYNLYLPCQKQVVLLDPRVPLENVKDIMNRKDVWEPVELGSHQKAFYMGQDFGFGESKTCQFKQIKADQSKRTTLADRMTGKSNKLNCYVSAFANYKGGHIYYGITDDGVVEGEVVANQEDKQDIVKKVEKVINKMIWPEHIGQPRRGKHWDIFFEAVEDKTSKLSTFVIVIYIASCLGGVFAEEPECYEIVEKKIKKMSFIAWSKRISEPVSLPFGKISLSVSRITWSSVKARKAFADTHKALMPLINNGDWKAILGKSKSLQGKPEFYSITLSILSKEITACFRRGHVKKAEKLLEEYKKLVTKGKDSFIFEVIGLYLEAALKRARGDNTDTFKGLLADALSKTELIESGVVAATVFVFAGTVLNDPMNLDYSPDVLSARALEHLQHESASSEVGKNLRNKASFIHAAFHLGCSIDGQRIKENVGRSGLDKARSIINRVQRSVDEGNPLSKYHEIQFNLVQSIYHYRHSQINPEERSNLLKDAFDCAKEAECLAEANQFSEMVAWSRANAGFCTEQLVLSNLSIVKTRGVF